MHRFQPALALAVALPMLVLLAPTRALADNKNPTPEEIAAARPLAKAGVKLAREGNCVEALPSLERARELYEAPPVPAVALGDCLIRAGKLVRGTEILEVVAHQILGANPERVNVDAKAAAQKLLDVTLPKIASLIIQVEAPAAEVTVLVDRQPLPKSLLGIGRPSDPGDHVVEASAPGLLTATRSVSLSEGQETSITLKLVPDPNAVHTVPLAHTGPAPAASKAPAIVLLGVGGAAIAAGVVTGVLALTTRSTLNRECLGHQCTTASAVADLGTLKTLSWVSTISLAAGVASAGVGATLLVLRRRSDTPKAAGPSVAASVGPGSVLVTGEF